jgi:hypothetical protein
MIASKKSPFNPIISLAHVHLDCHKALLPLHPAEHGVEGLKSYQNIVEISFPGTKALWKGEMICGSTIFILLAKTFAMILYITLHRLVG